MQTAPDTEVVKKVAPPVIEYNGPKTKLTQTVIQPGEIPQVETGTYMMSLKRFLNRLSKRTTLPGSLICTLKNYGAAEWTENGVFKKIEVEEINGK